MHIPNEAQRTHGNLKIAICLYFVFMAFANARVLGQVVDRKGKEEISITSSYKPSIVKSGKLEFRASPPQKDTAGYRFKYPTTKFLFKTPISSLSVKPLSYQAEQKPRKGADYFAKLGYGNLQNPFVSMGLNGYSDKQQFTVDLGHVSAKGKEADQAYSNSHIITSLQQILASGNAIDVGIGFSHDSYNLFGFDHNSYALPEQDIKQQFSNAHAKVAMSSVSGIDGMFFIHPELRFDYLMASRKTTEALFSFKAPYSLKLSSSLSLNGDLSVKSVQLNKDDKRIDALALVNLPVKLDFNAESFKVNAGIIPSLQRNKISVLPDLSFSYDFPNTGLQFFAELTNALELNSLHQLYLQNPYIIFPDSVTIMRKTGYRAGFGLHTSKGLEVRVKTGIVHFKNMPLFINSGVGGKDQKVLNETGLTAVNLDATLSYKISDAFSLGSDLKLYSFQDQNLYDKAYGIIPLDLNFRMDWHLFSRVGIRFKTMMWRGPRAATPGKPDSKLDDAADISLGVDFKLNKKWALWSDLNNIANTKYQRWNQYPSFGFNMVAGIRYSFNQKD